MLLERVDHCRQSLYYPSHLFAHGLIEYLVDQLDFKHSAVLRQAGRLHRAQRAGDAVQLPTQGLCIVLLQSRLHWAPKIPLETGFARVLKAAEQRVRQPLVA